MSIEFLQALGFSEDPFASTNAADEPRIGNYFVAPPFFPAVVGNPEAPKSNVVFAPRGGGKTAQKIMIEQASSKTADFLCVSYDRFPLERIKTPGQASSDYHLRNISRILLVAILIEFERDPSLGWRLDDFERKLIVGLSRELLGGLSSEQFRDALSAIKSLGDKALDTWNKYGGVIVTLVNAVAIKLGLDKVEISKGEKAQDESIRFKFDSLVEFSQKIGYNSVYILVDRVDELPITAQNATKVFEFLESILIDLPLLETKGVAFKFFLWDQMKDAYHIAGGRPDRLIEYELEWRAPELETVLSRRMETYSNGAINSFNDILAGDELYDVHKLITYFAHNSPRDMIRICKKIVDEHTKSGVYGDRIEFRTVKSAIMQFSNERARELYGEHFSDLRKIRELDFTIPTLANDIFRVSQQAARSKVQKWQDSGAVVRIGEVPNPGNRPLYLFGIVDPRLALAVLGDTTLEDAVEDYLITCPHCQNLRIRWTAQDITCPDCQGTFKATEAAALAVECPLPPKS